MSQSGIERWVDKVLVKDGCWEWTGSRSRGYGQMKLNGRIQRAHRAAYAFFVGEIPASLFVLHHCDNPSCVKPSHLFLGTQADNMQDAVRKGRRAVNAGENNPASKLTWEDVREIRAVRGRMTHREIAGAHGVSPAAVSAILSGRKWRVAP